MLELSGPIVIFSFDRPQYLERLLGSLKTQRLVKLNESQIYLLQDGAISQNSGVRFAEDEPIQKCIELFRTFFPRGQVMQSSTNLGIGLNIRRGEKIVFEELDKEVGYFFEDDLELGPLYMNIMESLYKKLSCLPNVGYFAAYGDVKAQLPGPQVRMVSMAHNWGFGLMRQAWRKIDVKLQPYYKLLQGRDYGARNQFRLYDLMRNSTVATQQTSQDAFKMQACAELGIARLRTDVCFARYIGEHGIHFTPTVFDRHGFREMKWVDRDDIEILPIHAVDVQDIHMYALHGMQRFRNEDFEKMVSDYSSKRMDEDRLVTRDDVDLMHALILDKRPHGENIYKTFVGKRTIRELRRKLIYSDEFRIKNSFSVN